MKLISICVPVYNEENNINYIVKKIDNFFEKIKSKYKYEILFTDNNSSDETEKNITELCKINNKIKYIKFEKNIGYDLSIFYNLMSANGDASIVIDCDLQDPVEMISEFLSYWEKGYEVVYGVRMRKNEENFFYFFRKFFYIILHFFSKKKYPLYAGDFRLVDKKITKQFNLNKKEAVITRCISFDYSNKTYGVPYNRVPRLFDNSKYPFGNALNYALETFILKTDFFEKFFLGFYFLIFFFGFLFFLLNKSIMATIVIFVLSFFLNIVFLLIKKLVKRMHYEKKNTLKVVKTINL